MMNAHTAHMSTADHAAVIRQTLKTQHGWTSRQVSVKAHNYSMGSSIRITIKDGSVPIAAVEAIANQAERIDRDQWGDILSGGNRFVFVNYDSDAMAVMAERWMGAVDAAYLEMVADGRESGLYEIPGTSMRLGKSNNGFGFSLWANSGHAGEYNDLAGIARGVAVRVVNSMTADAVGGVQ